MDRVYSVRSHVRCFLPRFLWSLLFHPPAIFFMRACPSSCIFSMRRGTRSNEVYIHPDAVESQLPRACAEEVKRESGCRRWRITFPPLSFARTRTEEEQRDDCTTRIRSSQEFFFNFFFSIFSSFYLYVNTPTQVPSRAIPLLPLWIQQCKSVLRSCGRMVNQHFGRKVSAVQERATSATLKYVHSTRASLMLEVFSRSSSSQI